jgi:N4-(beta-N-acetylglucosaminyl)-L-asparaginase
MLSIKFVNNLEGHQKRLMAMLSLMMMLIVVGVLVLAVFSRNPIEEEPPLPIVLSTWAYVNATDRAWSTLVGSTSDHRRSSLSASPLDTRALDAVERGCNYCEIEPKWCRWSVGGGGAPDESGETTLDAMIIWGKTHDVGAVGNLKRIREAITVARFVLNSTYHTLLVGDDARIFAEQMGLQRQSLATQRTIEIWQQWAANGRVPNYWKYAHRYSDDVPPDFFPPPHHNHSDVLNVGDDSSTAAASRHRRRSRAAARKQRDDSDDFDWRAHVAAEQRQRRRQEESVGDFGYPTHNAIGMIAIDGAGNVAAGTSTNGIPHKIPGRVGDSPIPGAGAYADNDVGAAVATGDGDIFMRFLPTLLAVEHMRQGMSPTDACKRALERIRRLYPTASGAIVAANIHGQYGAAKIGNLQFDYTTRNVYPKESIVHSL